MKLATNESDGAAMSSEGTPIWRSSPVDENSDAVGEDCRVLEVVRDEEDGEIEPVEHVRELGAHARASVRVEGGERLVEEEPVGLARQCAGKSDALALTTRKLARVRFREMGDPESVEHLPRARPACVGDVAFDRHVREERVLLEDEADPPLLGRPVDPRPGVEERAPAE